MDLGETIRKQVLEAVDAALRAAPKNIASATNVSSSGHTVSSVSTSTSGHTVSVYVDDEVTIVERDGKRRVIRHDEDEGEPTADAGGGEEARPKEARPEEE